MTEEINKIEEIEDNIDIINMKLNELKEIQRNHDNLIKRLNYNFRYDLLKLKNNNKIILMKRKKENNYDDIIGFGIVLFGIMITLICCEYIFSFLRYIQA